MNGTKILSISWYIPIESKSPFKMTIPLAEGSLPKKERSGPGPKICATLGCIWGRRSACTVPGAGLLSLPGLHNSRRDLRRRHGFVGNLGVLHCLMRVLCIVIVRSVRFLFLRISLFRPATFQAYPLSWCFSNPLFKFPIQLTCHIDGLFRGRCCRVVGEYWFVGTDSVTIVW